MGEQRITSGSMLAFGLTWVLAISSAWAATGGLEWSTFLGGSGADYGYDIAVDSSSNVYVTGPTYSSDFPTTAGAFDTTWNGDNDVFVAKLNPGGTGLVYSTFIGGGGSDTGRGIAVGATHDVYLTGRTESADFPSTVGALDTVLGGTGDAFVVKLNAAGTTLVYATFLGGAFKDDYGQGIVMDSSGSAYITGATNSSDFPTTSGAHDTTYGGSFDGFVAKLNAAGSTLIYSTLLGGGPWDWPYAITVNGSGEAYITGETASVDILPLVAQELVKAKRRKPKAFNPRDWHITYGGADQGLHLLERRRQALEEHSRSRRVRQSTPSRSRQTRWISEDGDAER